ncbi:MAG: proton-conducting transporter membrane subunit, partial [Planctomycetota bacterium]|nr:proton-conducting transporter membrane subunit [Planctomycetota bacterium]
KAWTNVIAGLCVLNILYCGFAAMRQRDMKYVIGYSSCSHMGYVLLGIASLKLVGITGAVYMIWAHGIMAALAFSLIGHIYAETRTKDLDQLGGLARRLPYLYTAFVFMVMDNHAIPVTPNYLTEQLVVMGSWQAELYLPAVLAVFGIVVTATYMLRMIRDGLFGPEKTPEVGMKDATSLIDRAPSLILISVLLITGCFPNILLAVIESGARMIVQRL